MSASPLFLRFIWFDFNADPSGFPCPNLPCCVEPKRKSFGKLTNVLSGTCLVYFMTRVILCMFIPTRMSGQKGIRLCGEVTIKFSEGSLPYAFYPISLHFITVLIYIRIFGFFRFRKAILIRVNGFWGNVWDARSESVIQDRAMKSQP